ncbi:MBL fold metallo-hydrolase [Eubacteriales bacterium SGI.150]
MKKKMTIWLLALLLLLSGCGESEGTEPALPDSPDGIVSEEVVQQPQADISDSEESRQDDQGVDGDTEPSPSEPPDALPEQTPPPDVTTPPENSTFEVHFIDVGQGDSSLILCDGKAMLIDGGEASESSKVYAYLKKLGVNHLDYIVATHAHSDHIGGLSGALNYASVDTALCPVTSYDSKTFNSFTKYLSQQGASITVPEPGDTFSLGSASVTILGPQRSYEDTNDTSIVMKVVYGKTSFLFTGDAERTAEADILDAGYDLSATVLKVGHHGSDTSTSYPFLREIMPEYAVIQVGKGNSYGHPTEDTLSKLRDADVKVYRNDLQGTIICTSDGETISFSTEKNESVQANTTVTTTPEPNDVGEYIGNKNSKKFHLPTCKNLPAEKNRVFFDSRQDAVNAGFDPCGNCHP